VPTYSEEAGGSPCGLACTAFKAIADELKVRLAEEPRDDSEIARAIAHLLEWNTPVPEGRVHARVQGGWVILEGEVEWDYQRHEFERMVRHVRGVVGITSNIVVDTVSEGGEGGGRDGEAFRREAEIDARHIKVDVSDHAATLHGHVRSLNDAEAAALLPVRVLASPLSRATSS
jgi:osmotically-inducible protein OsmY